MHTAKALSLGWGRRGYSEIVYILSDFLYRLASIILLNEFEIESLSTPKVPYRRISPEFSFSIFDIMHICRMSEVSERSSTDTFHKS